MKGVKLNKLNQPIHGTDYKKYTLKYSSLLNVFIS